MSVEFAVSVSYGNVPIHWLEYRRTFDPSLYPPGVTKTSEGQAHTVEVTYETASRRGEPFFELLQWLKSYRTSVKGEAPILPNPVQRMCTDQLKIKTGMRWMKQRGYPDYTSVVGIRADEPRRIARAKGRLSDELFPLARAGIVKADVQAFWKSQPFDLKLDPNSDEGNCTLCFMKARAKIEAIMRKTSAHDWFWVEAEQMTGTTFRRDRPSYQALREQIDREQAEDTAAMIAGQPCQVRVVPSAADDGGDCFCGPAGD